MLRPKPVSTLILILISLCNVALLLTACAGNDNEPDQAVPVAEETATPQALLIWHPYRGAERDALEQIRLNFQVAHPNINVQLEFFEESSLRAEYETAVRAGAGPDLLFGPAAWVPVLATQGTIQLLSQELFDQISDNQPESIARATFIADVPYGVAFSAEFATLYYNRALIEAPPDILDDLINLASAHHLLIAPTFFATSGLYLSSGGQLMDINARNLVTPSDLIAFLNELQTLARTPGVTFTSDQADFLQGQTGMLIASSANYPALQAALGDDLGIARLPRIPPSQWRALTSIQLVMQNINSTAEAVDAAELFLAFLISSGAQRDWFEQTRHAPVNATELADDALRTAWSHALEWSVPAPLPGEFAALMYPLLDQAVQAVTLDGDDPTTTTAAILNALQSEE